MQGGQHGNLGKFHEGWKIFLLTGHSLVYQLFRIFDAVIIIVSILQKIFGSNCPLPIYWEENHNPEGRKYYQNHITKSTQRYDPRSSVSQRMPKNSQHVAQITGIPHQPPTLRLGIGYDTLAYNIFIHLSLKLFLTSPYLGHSFPTSPNLPTIKAQANVNGS